MSEQVLIKAFTAQDTIAKNRFVAISSDKVRLATSSGKAIGVNCSFNVKADERVDIGVLGIFEVEASIAINAGVSVASTTEGRAATHSSRTSDKVGIALNSASRSGDLLRILVIPQ